MTPTEPRDTLQQRQPPRITLPPGAKIRTTRFSQGVLRGFQAWFAELMLRRSFGGFGRIGRYLVSGSGG